MRTSASLFALLAAAATLTGCGFHLAGALPLKSRLAVVSLVAVDTQSEFYFGLRKALMAAGTRIDDDHADANAAVIHVTEDNPSERVLTVSTLNIPTQYELTYTVEFTVEAQGKDLIPSEKHVLLRDYSYSEAQQLAKERERALLSDALAQDLVSVVMRRLASL